MSLDSDMKLLARVKLFAGFEQEHLRLLAFGAELRTFETGQQIFRKDSVSEGGYVVSSGLVDLFSGNNDEVVTSFGQGALMGELALITETLNSATAVARERTEVLKISRPLFLRMLNEYPQLAGHLQKRIIESVDEFNRKLDVIRAKLDHATDLATRKPKAQA